MATTHDFYSLNSSVPAKLTPEGVFSNIEIIVQNVNQSGYIYLGGSDVSSSSYGFRLGPDQSIRVKLTGKATIYAIPSENNLNLAVLKLV